MSTAFLNKKSDANAIVITDYQAFLDAGWTTGYESIDNPTEEA